MPEVKRTLPWSLRLHAIVGISAAIVSIARETRAQTTWSTDDFVPSLPAQGLPPAALEVNFALPRWLTQRR